MEQLRRRSRKILIGILGGLVVVIGLILVPYPGPGWLVVFAGLAILSTEFTFAEKVLHYAREKYDSWSAWLKRQHWSLQLGMFLVTCIIVTLTLWLMNAYGIFVTLFHLPWDWLISPLFR